jgi:hypothetical protein
LIQASSYTVTQPEGLLTHERSTLFARVSVEQTSVLSILLVTLTLFFKWLFLGFSTPPYGHILLAQLDNSLKCTLPTKVSTITLYN